MSSNALPISDAWFHRIKSATRDLIKLAGGVVRAGEIASTSKSEVSRWQTPTYPDIIPLASALALEAECGVPLITSVMADLHGRRLTDPAGSDAVGSVAGVQKRYAELLRNFAEVTSTTAAAIEDDGDISLAEAEIIDRALANTARSIDEKRKAIAALKAAARGLHVVG